MELVPGGMLGPYRLVAQAGRGGMAEVWQAYQPSLRRYVAVKILPRHLAAQPGYIERFEREALTISRLDHPNILAVFDFGEQDGFTYMVTPFVEGGTLTERLGRRWPVGEALEILEPLASALDYAHGRGVVHRDVKPSNVLLGESERPRLSDFGVARMLESTSALTHTGALIGTPAYMSPEQAEGQPAGPASDRYSLGIVAYEMLTGRVPFEAETPMAVALAHLHRPLPPPRSVNPSLSPEVEAVLLKALAKSSTDRFDTARAVTAALAAGERAAPRGRARPADDLDETRTLGYAGVAVSPVTPVPAQAPAPSRPPKVILMATGLLGVAAVGAILSQFSGLGGPERSATARATSPAAARTAGVTATAAPLAVTHTPMPAALVASPTPSAIPDPTAAPVASPTIPAAAPASPTPTEDQAIGAALARIDAPWARGDWDAVIGQLAPLADRYPQNAELREKLYVAYLQQGRGFEIAERPTEARAPYTAAVKLNPARPDARARLDLVEPVRRSLLWRPYRWAPGLAYEDAGLRASQEGEIYVLESKQPGRAQWAIRSTTTLLERDFVVLLSARMYPGPGGLVVALAQDVADQANATYLLYLFRQNDGEVWARLWRSPDPRVAADSLAAVGPNSPLVVATGAPNSIRFERRGGGLTVALNGTQLWSGPVTLPTQRVIVGVWAEAQPGARVGLFEYYVYAP